MLTILRNASSGVSASWRMSERYLFGSFDLGFGFGLGHGGGPFYHVRIPSLVVESSQVQVEF